MSLAKTTPRIVALVPSAGVGARAQSQVPSVMSNAAMPKQYCLLAGVPMLRRSVQALLNEPRIEQVRVVVALGDLLATQCLAGLPRTVCCPCGGATRAQTVLNGLQDAQLRAEDWVLVHDAARPGLPAEALARLIDSCLPHSVGGLLAMPVADTVKRSHPTSPKTVQQTIARESLWLAQTPQMFRAGLLEQVFTPEQYATNVETVPGSGARVEFAIKLPGRRDDGAPLWLPIDAKFPREDYERLLDAQERADKPEAEAAGRAIETRLRAEAKTIRDKYVAPPHTTEFAILFVPTEGLYAEALRRPGLMEALQREYRVTLAGPTTLLATLNSLQMGFKTLAIEKSASDVWKVLGAAKTEFNKYSVVLDKLAKQLETAQNTVTEAGVRTRAVSKSLSKVEELEIGVSSADILGLPLAGSSDDEELDLEERQ